MRSVAQLADVRDGELTWLSTFDTRDVIDVVAVLCTMHLRQEFWPAKHRRRRCDEDRREYVLAIAPLQSATASLQSLIERVHSHVSGTMPAVMQPVHATARFTAMCVMSAFLRGV